MPSTIAINIAKVRERIRSAAEKYQRPSESVTLMAVSKTRPAASIREAFEAGASDIGENYLQEALDKQAELEELPLTWHFIGPIQSNKTRPIASHFDWVHSVDRLKIARRLSEQRPEALPPLNICLQVNISRESSKSGFSPEEVIDATSEIAKLPNLSLRGLMAIPAATDDIEAQRATFAEVRALLAALQASHPKLDTLSMGMSGDLEAAVAEGASIVRIGSDIFGPRA